MSDALRIAKLGPVLIESVPAGLRVSAADLDPELLLSPGTWPAEALSAPGGSDAAYDLAVEAEADAAVVENGGAIVPFESVLRLLSEQRPLACRWVSPSPFLLTVDRNGDIGVPGFQYRVGWYLGSEAVPLMRVGAYVRWASRGTNYRLDPTTAAMVENMERFNLLPDAQRSRGATWSTFGAIRGAAEKLGVELDSALRSNSVVFPSAVGLELVHHADGSMSFAPRVPELGGDAFKTAFFNNADVPEVYSLSRPDGTRVRVILQERHREVLRRMKRVTRQRGEKAKKFAEQPEAVFDGILADVDVQYGQRVFGIGQITLSPAPKDPNSGGIVGALAAGMESERRPPDAVPTTTERVFSVVEAETVDGRSIELAMTSLEEQAELADRIADAIARGETVLEVAGERICLDADLLSRLTSANAAQLSAERAYLLIYQNDEELDAVDASALGREQEDAPDVPLRLPESLEPAVSLRNHQREGIHWLSRCFATPRRTGVLLADDMGLGKTLQVLAWTARFIEDGRTDDGEGNGRDGPFRPILIIAPLMLVDTQTWTREMEKRFRSYGAVFRPWHVLHGHGIADVSMSDDGRDLLGRVHLDPEKLMRFRVIITTYETIVNYQHSLAQLVGGRSIWSVVVTDEAQNYKEMRTKVSHAIKALSPPFHIAATGTPVETRLLNLWNIIDAGQPGLLGTAREFTRRFETPIATGTAPVPDVLDELRSQLLFGKPNTFVLRRGKEQLTDLPLKHERVVNCQMNVVELGHEQRLIGALGRGAGKQTLHVLQELVARGQHPLFEGGRIELGNPEELIRSSTKLKATLDLLEEIRVAGEKVLLFARHIAVQQMLSAVIRHRFGIEAAIINGQTGRAQTGSSVGAHRRKLLDRFEGAPGFGAIVLSPFVAGVGLTITAANHVIHYGRWWNPAVESQATDRAYRIGQTLPVTVYYPILRAPEGALVNGTFDEALHALIDRRRKLARDFLHPDASEGELAAALTDALSGSVDQKVKVDELGRDLPATVAAAYRRDGWMPFVFDGAGYGGAAGVMFRQPEAHVVPLDGVASKDAIASWSRIFPTLRWSVAMTTPSLRGLCTHDVIAERARAVSDPGATLVMVRRAIETNS
jgi:hypothetical protein